MSYEYDGNSGLQPQPPKKNNNNDLGSWILIAVMFAVAWPVGLILLLSKLSEGSGRKMRQQAREAWQRTAAGSAEAKPAQARASAAKNTVRKVTETPNYSDKGAKTMKIIGAVVGILGCVAMLSAVSDNLSYAYHYNEWWYFAPAPEGYAAILAQIRDLNDRIADERLSAQMDRMEQVAGRIFRLIEEDEDKRAAAGTFLSYYLPTTLKLLENYAAFEEAGVSGENLSQAKAKIEKTMDSIVAGFEHQLDELYRTDAMDIDSDIRVMETMLRRDTASVADDFGLNGGSAVQQKES